MNIKLISVPEEQYTKDDYNQIVENSDSFRTPINLFNLATSLTSNGFNIDVAASSSNTLLNEYLIDGLISPWNIGYIDPCYGRVWCNPPYSNVTEWINKGIQELNNVEYIMYLLRFDPSTRWFNKIIKYTDTIYVLTSKRVRFLGIHKKEDGTFSTNSSSIFPHALFYLKGI